MELDNLSTYVPLLKLWGKPDGYMQELAYYLSPDKISEGSVTVLLLKAALAEITDMLQIWEQHFSFITKDVENLDACCRALTAAISAEETFDSGDVILDPETVAALKTLGGMVSDSTNMVHPILETLRKCYTEDRFLVNTDYVEACSEYCRYSMYPHLNIVSVALDALLEARKLRLEASPENSKMAGFVGQVASFLGDVYRPEWVEHFNHRGGPNNRYMVFECPECPQQFYQGATGVMGYKNSVYESLGWHLAPTLTAAHNRFKFARAKNETQDLW